MEHIKTALLLWPFDLATTIWLAFFVYQCIALIIKKQWGALKKYAYEESLKFFVFNLEKNAKLKAVVGGLRAKLPPMLRPFVSDEKLIEMVDSVYQQKVKPEAKRMGLDKVQKVEPGSLDALIAGIGGGLLAPALLQQLQQGAGLAQDSAQRASEYPAEATAQTVGPEPAAEKTNGPGLFGF